jgi:hypothetical protein
MRRALGFAALALLSLIALAPTRADAQSTRYVTRLANRNRIGLTVSNYGFFGNNFTSRSPSLEFPLGSGFEHMSRAGPRRSWTPPRAAPRRTRPSSPRSATW